MLGKYLNEKNIGRISLINMLTVIVVLGLAMVFYIVKQADSEFDVERAQLVKSYIDNKKNTINNETSRLRDFVDFSAVSTRESVVQDLKKHVDDAAYESYHIATFLHGGGSAGLNDYIKSFLINYKWGEGKKSLYIINRQGIVIYHPDFKPGTDLSGVKSPDGSYPVREEIKEAFSHGSAVIENYFPEKAGSRKFVKRTVYVKKFGMYDWYIASASDDNELRDLVLKQLIAKVKAGKFDEGGRYFLMSSDGKGMLIPGNDWLNGKNVSGVHDYGGVNYYKELIKNRFDGREPYFVFYNQEYKNWGRSSQVIANCKLYARWHWMLCGTVQIDDLNNLIEQKNVILKKRLMDNEKYALLMFIIAAIISAVISWYFSKHVEKIFRKYHEDIESRNRGLEELNIELTNQLYTDHLTSLPNRNKLVNDLNTVAKPILILLNIDSFKKINETYGFIIGDFVLIDVGERISTFKCEPEARCYKFHGNEYAMLIDCDMSRDALVVLMNRLAEHLDFTVRYDELEIEIDISITAGISAEKGNIFEKAGMAMRLAEKKKQPYVIYDNSMDMVDEYENDIKWTKVVKRALNENHLVPFFQPIANSETGEIEKFECLVRIIEGDSIISPFQFLDIIKKTKLYQHVTKRVIAKSFEVFAENDFTFTINLSIEDIANESTSRYILDMLKTSGIAGRVIFELLESEGIESFSVVNDFIKEIKQTGAKVAIDDFGSGYSNFVYLSELNVDILKIDGSLIKNIDHDRQSQIIVGTIVKFANQLNIKTVAEFVHSESVRDKVLEMGIDYLQGYYIGKPTDDITGYMH